MAAISGGVPDVVALRGVVSFGITLAINRAAGIKTTRIVDIESLDSGTD